MANSADINGTTLCLLSLSLWLLYVSLLPVSLSSLTHTHISWFLAWDCHNGDLQNCLIISLVNILSLDQNHQQLMAEKKNLKMTAILFSPKLGIQML